MGELVKRLTTPYVAATAGPLIVEEQPAYYGWKAYEIESVEGKDWGGRLSLQVGYLIRLLHGDIWSLGGSARLAGNLSAAGENKWATMEMHGGLFLEWEKLLSTFSGIVDSHEAHGLAFQSYVSLGNNLAFAGGLIAIQNDYPLGIATEDPVNEKFARKWGIQDKTIGLFKLHFNFGLAYFF